ncbi:hypothetical protein CU633_07040 [Bacillus sp. V3-13]|uniref:glycosyltransferase family 39 protein n=1 Tax=Bacillus sp. V3-13 TaxID=2053728 RepID=UPI000C78DED1|nr:glycosyltransferase family 39 protein [Bacillus sp. V3-13]PLR78263.1 hypothetical protein CU633_07040 [Bacillus sp. V3-13]
MNRIITKNLNLNHFFIISLLLALIVRLMWIYYIPNETISDFAVYHRIATSLADGKVPADFGYQGMGYPALLSVFFKLFGTNDIMIAKVLNVVLSIITLVFIFLILKKLIKNPYVISIVFLLISFLPNHIAYTNVVGTEVLTNFFFSLIILLQVSSLKNKYRYPLLGFIIGLATLTKPYFLVYPLVLGVMEWLNKKDIKKAILIGLVSFLFLQLTISPWTFFNYQRSGQFVPVSSNGGTVLFLNNNADNKTGTYMDPDHVTTSQAFKEKISKLEPKTIAADEAYKEEALKWIINNPLDFVKLGLLRVKNTFFTNPWDIPQYTMTGIDFHNLSETNNKIYTISYQLLDGFLLVTNILGFIYVFMNVFIILFTMFKKNKKLSYLQIIPTLNIGMFTLIHFVFEGQPRYAFPVLFLLVLSAVLMIIFIYNTISNRKQGSYFLQ